MADYWTETAERLIVDWCHWICGCNWSQGPLQMCVPYWHCRRKGWTLKAWHALVRWSSRQRWTQIIDFDGTSSASSIFTSSIGLALAACCMSVELIRFKFGWKSRMAHHIITFSILLGVRIQTHTMMNRFRKTFKKAPLRTYWSIVLSHRSTLFYSG